MCEMADSWSGSVSTLSAYAILYYDYFLTLPKEVEGYWHTGPHAWGSILFLANRYVAMLGHLPFFYIYFRRPCKSSHIASFSSAYHGVLVLVLAALTGIILGMRVYALYYPNKWVLGIVIFEAAVAIALACWSLTRLLPGGAIAAGPTPAYRRPVAVAFSGLLLFDFTIFILTIYRSFRLWNRREPFLHRFFLDGLLYYGVICSLNLLNIIVLVVIKPRIDLSTPIFTNLVSVAMVSRLMINLREVTLDKPANSDGTDTASHAGPISTVVLEDTFLSVGTAPESSSQPSSHAASA